MTRNRRLRWWVAALVALAVWLVAGTLLASWLYRVRERGDKSAAVITAPYAGDGLTLGLDDFQILSELPAAAGKKPSVAPAGTKFAVVRLRQEVTDTATLGSCRLAFAHGDKRWTVPADFMNPLAKAESPLVPKNSLCQGRYSTPVPQVGDSFLIGIVVVVPASMADGIRPVATVTSANADTVREVWF